MSLTAKFILDAIDTEAMRVKRLTQCILYGLIEPSDQTITREMHLAISKQIIVELNDTFAEHPAQFLPRAKRAYLWAVRDTVPPEFGIFMGEHLRSLIMASATMPPEAQEIFETQEYRDYATKFQPIITALHSKSDRFVRRTYDVRGQLQSRANRRSKRRLH